MEHIRYNKGKFKYDELLEFLGKFYHNNMWADGYVLPDIVPISTDSDKIVGYKVRDTLFHCENFSVKCPFIYKNGRSPLYTDAI